MTRTYPLGVARAVAVRTLTELGTQRPGWRPNPDYWMELLAEALRQMVDATAPDRVIDVAPLPEHDAASAAEVAEGVGPCPSRSPGGHHVCNRRAGHDGMHEADGPNMANPLITWDPRPQPAGHLAQHTGGQPGCTYSDCRIHQPAPTREVSAAALAAHPLDGAR